MPLLVPGKAKRTGEELKLRGTRLARCSQVMQHNSVVFNHLFLQPTLMMALMGALEKISFPHIKIVHARLNCGKALFIC